MVKKILIRQMKHTESLKMKKLIYFIKSGTRTIYA